ncbi:MAG: recombinase family protein [Oscillospiraceae bacterium]|nr:recombinase family protein [Oscillospiraceae bacterium]
MTENALKCKFNGGGIPFGYTIDSDKHFQIDPLTSPIVLEAFKLYADGKTMKQIVDEFNERGLKPSSGGSFNLNNLNHLLKNRRYRGEYKYRDVVHIKGIPAIVPDELFDMVQEQLAKNKKAPVRHKAEDDYLLSTKLYCGKCGAYMVLALQKQENITLPMLRKQFAEIERGIENMLNAIQQGILNESTKKRLDDLEAAKSELNVKTLQEEMQKPLLTKEQIMFWLHKFKGIDMTKREQRQRLIDTFVNAVYIYDDRVVITFNYKDGSKTVTITEIEHNFSSDLEARGAPVRVFLWDLTIL